MKSQQSTRKAGGVSTNLGGGLQLFSTPLIIVTSSTQTDGSAQNPLTVTPSGTPKISVFLKDSSNIKVGNFGEIGIIG